MSILKYVDLYNQYKTKSGFLSITVSSKSSTKSEGPWGCWEEIMVNVIHMAITLWVCKEEHQKGIHPPEHVLVLIRNPDTSQVGNSTEDAPGAGAAETDIFNID